jgi:hypothetical protein
MAGIEPTQDASQRSANGFEDRVSNCPRASGNVRARSKVASQDPLTFVDGCTVRQNGCQRGCQDLCLVWSAIPNRRIDMSSGIASGPQLSFWFPNSVAGCDLSGSEFPSLKVFIAGSTQGGAESPALPLIVICESAVARHVAAP